MFNIKTSNRFEKDFIKCIKRNYAIEELEKALEYLESTGKLPGYYKPHKLHGGYNGYWECHVGPDWLLIWRQNNHTKVIELVRTGTHSDLF